MSAQRVLFYALLVPCTLLFYDLKVAERSYELERQDKSEAEGGYTTYEFLDMMTMLAEVNELSDQGDAATRSAEAAQCWSELC